MSKSVQELELENAELRRRIELLERGSLIGERTESDSQDKQLSRESTTPTLEREGSLSSPAHPPSVNGKNIHQEPIYALPVTTKNVSSNPPTKSSPQTPHLTPVAKFNDSLKRFKAGRSALRKSKQKSSFSPAKLLSKKWGLKLGTSEDKNVLENTPSTSSSSLYNTSSSQYDNLDGMLTTLQKMMIKSEENSKEVAREKPVGDESTNIIGQKLATHNDNQPNYDRIMNKLVRDRREQHSSIANQPHFGNEYGNEFVASSEDLSSLSTVSQDSSSSEHIYYFNPISHPRDNGFPGQPYTVPHFVPNQFAQNRMQKREFSFNKPLDTQENFTPTSHKTKSSQENVSKLLEQLSGESGYMVLSGKNPLLKEKPPHRGTHESHENLYMETTYGNVSKLMEAVRAAEARDAVRKNAQSQGKRREILSGRSYNQKMGKPVTRNNSSKMMTEEKGDRLESRPPWALTKSTQLDPFSAGGFTPQQNCLFTSNIDKCQETNLLTDTSTHNISFSTSQELKSRNPNSCPKLVSSKPVKYYQPNEDGALSGIEVFDPYHSPETSKTEKQLSEDSFGSRRNNYHIVSHPLSQKSKQKQTMIKRKRRNMRQMRSRKRVEGTMQLTK